MKQLTTLLTLALTLLCFHSNAQHQHTEKCGHTILMQSMETKYPGYTEAVNKTFEAAKARGKEYRLNGRVDVLTVPVVVHVVWNTSDSSQNLADSIIEDQIRILNEDYRRLNADAGNIRSEFEDIVGDAFIEFELDEIIRVSTTEEFEPGLTGLDDADAVKISAEGGSDAVDPLTNLNIWICEIQPITLLGIPIGEILGYAYPPANLVHWPDGSQAPIVAKEGVVLDYRTVGSNNPTSVHFENNGFTIVGRTAVHEVGHYLGLRHIWGDANALLGENGCEVDDGIYDTPNAAASNQQNGCNPSTNSCGASSANDLPDMWENYMDYSQEDCQNSFTLGQIDVLRGVLLCPRAGLLDPNDSPIDLPQTSIPVGPSSVPANGTVSYVAANSSNEFIWKVTGGTINSGQGTNTVQVTWGNSNPAFICLRESNGTCTGLPFCELVTINASCSTPTTGTITGNQNATTSTTEAYTVANSGNDYTWAVTGGSITSGQGTNTIQVVWAAGTSGQICLVESNGDCDGNEVCLDIVLCTVPSTGTITGAANAEVTTTETYSTSSTTSDFYWEVTGGSITSGAGTNSIVVTWGNGSAGEVCLVEGDGTCLGNEVCKSVVLNTPTGINEIAYSKSLNVYPNPATSFIRVNANEVPNRIELFDVLGSLLKSETNLQQNNTIFINNLNTKIVLVKVYFEDGFAVKRIVID